MPTEPAVPPEAVPQSPVATQIANVEGPDPALRIEAAKELARMGPAAREAVPALVTALQGSDARVAEEAARALGEIRDRSAVAPLVSALTRTFEEPSTALGRAAVRALARIGARRSPAVVEALLQAVQNAADPGVRAGAVSGLATVAADSPGVPAAALAVVAERDADEKIRKAAADAADKLDPAARRRLAAAAWLQKGQEAAKAGRLVDPREDCALAHALKALELDPQSRDAQRLHEQTIAAVRSEVRSAAKSDVPRAERLLEQAAAVEPGRPELEDLRTAIAEAKQEEYRRTHVFRLVHKHSSRAVLGGVIAIGDGKTRGCRGVFEILEDGFRFKTEQSEDSRRDDLQFTSAQVKVVQIRDQGTQIHIETIGGKYDFFGNSGDLRLIQQALAR